MTRRLVVSYVLVAAFVLIVVELPLGLTYAGRMQDRLLADVERDARVLAGLVEERVESSDPAAVAAIAEQYAAPIDGRVVITDETGLSLVDTSRPDDTPRDFSTRPEFVQALDGSQASGIRRSDTLDDELAYVAVPISSDGVVTGVVRVSFPTEQLREQIRDNWLRLGLLTVLVLAAAASVGWLIAKWAVGPVAALEEGAGRLAAGDLGGRAEVDRGPPELQHLAVTFNDMAARLESLVDSQRAFVADASHQLRTPLTALRLRIESLEDQLANSGGDDARQDVAAIAREVERLTRLVDGLLSLARSETATAVDVVDVADVAEDAVQRWSALADEHEVALTLEVVERTPAGRSDAQDPGRRPVRARVLAGGLDQVLDNLLDNAIEVSPAGSRIEVTVAEGADGVTLRVRDHGPGMTPAQRERATDRFWRGPTSGPGGSGLGLAIVSEIATVSGGSVVLDAPGDGSGLVVEVELLHPR